MVELMVELHRRVQDEDSLLDLLSRASREAVRSIYDADWAGVTLRFAGEPFTAAHTDPRVLIVDQGQYGQGDGPCLAAMRTDQWVNMAGADTRLRWPHLAPIALAAGVRAFLATPLHAGNRAVGSLNLYSGRAEGLRIPDPDVLTVLTGYLDRGLTDYTAAQPGQNGALMVQRLLRDRRVVAQAADIVLG
jgi:GAF domain-containing protein